MNAVRLKFPLVLVTILIFIGGFFVFSKSAQAAPGINKKINFQGKVVNTDGTNVTNNSYNFLFCIYTTDSPASPCTAGANNDAIWRESKSITVTDGVFQTNLGDTTTFPGAVDFNTDNIFLGINFNSNGQMTPLVQFTATPYAFNADSLDGKDWTAPGTIGSATPNTASFTTLNSSGITQLATTAGSTFAIGNTTGTATLVSGGASSWNNTSGNLTVSTTTSGTLAITSAGALNLSSASASTVTLANVTNALNFDTDTLSIDASNNRVGIGTSAPGAFLAIRGGTTASASLRIEAGVAPTAPGNGDLWYEAGHLYFRDSTTKDLLAGGGMAISGAISGATSGSVLFVNSSGQLAEDNASFFWEAGTDSLGIGTTDPSQTLSIISANPAVGAGYAGVAVLSGAAGSYTSLAVGRTAPELYLGISGGAQYLTDAVAGSGVIVHTGKLFFGSTVGGASQVTMDTTGNVGIGTTNPLYGLEVADGRQVLFRDNVNLVKRKGLSFASGSYPVMMADDTGGQSDTLVLSLSGTDKSFVIGGAALLNDYDHGVQINPTLFINSVTDPDTNNTEWGSLSFEGTGAGGGYLKIANGVGNMALMPVGNVGIGTTNPNDKLQINGGGLLVSGTAIGGAGAHMDYFNNIIARFFSYDYGNSTYGTASINDTMYLTGGGLTGNVGIGTTSPGNKLTIAQSANDDGLKILGYDDNSTDNLHLFIENVGYSNIVSNSRLQLAGLGGDNVLEVWNNLIFLHQDIQTDDDKELRFGTNWDFQLKYDETTDDRLELDDGTNLFLTIKDQGTASDFSFNEGQVFIQNNGYVGIGTTAPTALLALTGSTTSRASLNIATGTAPTSPNNGDLWYETGHLYFRDTTTKDLLAGGGMAISGAISGATSGSVLFVNSSAQLAQDNASFFWEAGTDSLGIGTTDPNAFLSVTGATTSRASLNIAAGSTPSAPNNGDLWYETGHLYFRDTTTKDLLAGGGGTSEMVVNIFPFAAASQASATTGYMIFESPVATNGADVNKSVVIESGTVKSLVVSMEANTVNGNATFTIFKNGTAQSLSVTIASGQTSGSDLSNSFSVSQGDVISMRVVTAGSSGTLTRPRASCKEVVTTTIGSQWSTFGSDISFITGNVGIGTTAPAALLALTGSTTSRSSLNIATGTAPTAPNNGDLWYETGHLYFRDSTTKDLLASSGGGTLQTAYDATSGNTILTTTGRNIAFTLQEVGTPTSFTLENQDTAGTSAQRIFNSITSGNTLTNGLLIEQTGTGTVTNAIQILETAGAVTTGINIGNGVATGISIGTGVTTGISVGSGGITITAGALAVNSDSITSDGTLVINASGTVDVDDILNANSITSDAGVSIADGSSYTGAGAVTVSSGGSAGLTFDSASGTTTFAAGDTALTASGVTTLTLGAGVAITNASGNMNLQPAGTGTGNVQIGDGGTASATPDLLVLDTGSAEPSGTVGAMYYSTALGKFRCYQGTAWTDCIGTGTGGGPIGSDTQIAFNNAGTESGDAGLTYNTSTKTFGLNGTDTEINMTGITNEPSAPASGTINLYAKSIAGRMFPKWVGPSGLDSPVQPMIAMNKIGYWNPAGNATTVPGVFGFTAFTAGGAATARNVATTNLFTRTRRLGYYYSTAGTTAIASARVAVNQYSVGDGSGLGGFFLVTRFGQYDSVASGRMFVGMTSATGAPTSVEPNTLTNAIGVGCGASNTALQIYYGGSAAQTEIDLGSNFPCNGTGSTDLYELILYAPVNANDTVHYRVSRLGTAYVATGTLTAASPGTQLPASTTLLSFRAWRAMGGTSGSPGIDIASVYIETDY